ncbi:MAG: hypothetical protein RLN81_14805 [Balneolaceae bacterium]
MSLFQDSKPNDIENWVCVLESTFDYEIELARNYLSNLKIPSNILSKRDTAYSLVVGDMAQIYLYVPNEFEKRARKVLEALNESNDETGFEDGEDN